MGRNPPETVAQARGWDRTCREYQSYGLCRGCAGQAAYGHQQHAGSWSELRPPCPECVPVVATFPVACGTSPWRRLGALGTGRVPAVRRARQEPVTPCGGCGVAWSGRRAEHCPACHETFAGETAGDRHRTGRFGVDRRCRSASEMLAAGMAQYRDAQTGATVWRMARARRAEL